MDRIETLDQLISHLQELRETIGGDAPGSARVALSLVGVRQLQPIDVGLAAVGKSDPTRLVSRGGVPCVVFSG